MSAFAVRQEPDEVGVAALMRIAVTSLVVGAAGVFFAGVILWATVGAVHPDFAGPAGPRPAMRTYGRIEQTPIWDSQEGLDLQARQRRELARWGWVSRPAGIAIIPIDEAMDIVVRENAR